MFALVLLAIVLAFATYIYRDDISLKISSKILVFISALSFIVAIILYITGFQSDDWNFYTAAIILFAVSVILAKILISLEFYSAAKQKGFNDKKYFWYSLLLGLSGYLLIIALPNSASNSQITEK